MTCKQCKNYDECQFDAACNNAVFDPDVSAEYCTGFELITNADRIRAMSDEELAAFMFSMVDCVSCQNKLMNNGKLVFGADRKTCTDKDYYAMCDGDGRKCESVCLEWLKQPAGEE